MGDVSVSLSKSATLHSSTANPCCTEQYKRALQHITKNIKRFRCDATEVSVFYHTFFTNVFRVFARAHYFQHGWPQCDGCHATCPVSYTKLYISIYTALLPLASPLSYFWPPPPAPSPFCH